MSFLLTPPLLASSELLVETEIDRAANQGRFWSSCAQYLCPLVQSQAGSNTVHQATTETLSGLIGLMITDVTVAIRDIRAIFSSVIMLLPGKWVRG